MQKKSRKERMKDLLSQVAAMTDQQREELSKGVPIINPDGRYLSPRNQMLLLLQIDSPTIVGGYKQWKQHGRQVRKGESGSLIFFPVGPKDKESGEIEDAERFYTGIVFDISQTEEINPEQDPVNTWEKETFFNAEAENAEDLEPGFSVEHR
jgi:hypothetical protein